MPYASGRVIHDADAHIMEVPGFLEEHLEARYRAIVTDAVLFPRREGFHGHRTEARNYAIVGQTLWIYTEQDSRKVPLADLDVAATKNANSDRGIIFQVPPTK